MAYVQPDKGMPCGMPQPTGFCSVRHAVGKGRKSYRWEPGINRFRSDGHSIVFPSQLLFAYARTDPADYRSVMKTDFAGKRMRFQFFQEIIDEIVRTISYGDDI